MDVDDMYTAAVLSYYSVCEHLRCEETCVPCGKDLIAS